MFKMSLANESRKILLEVTTEHPKKHICLWDDKTPFSLQFIKLMLFSHYDVSKILSRRPGDNIIDIYSKETWLAVRMRETCGTREGTKC